MWIGVRNMKELKATRVPPGDRWAIVDGDDQIHSSLTEVYCDGHLAFSIPQTHGDCGQTTLPGSVRSRTKCSQVLWSVQRGRIEKSASKPLISKPRGQDYEPGEVCSGESW